MSSRVSRLAAAGLLSACLLLGAPGPAARRALAQALPGSAAKAPAPAVPAVPGQPFAIGGPVGLPAPGLQGPPPSLALPAPASQPPAVSPQVPVGPAAQPARAFQASEEVSPTSEAAWTEAARRVDQRLGQENSSFAAKTLLARSFPFGGGEEFAAALRLKSILGSGGAISGEDRPFLDLWFPRAYRTGLIGRQPSIEERIALAWDFPKLWHEPDWRITGEQCLGYNCISWSVNVTDSWLWPGASLASFDSFYRERGYLPYGGPNPESTADILLWAHGPERCTHASRRIAGGWWESKIGGNPRIIHRLAHLEGDFYGTPFKFYIRE